MIDKTTAKFAMLRCTRCGNRIGRLSAGSLTGWLFREARCHCEHPAIAGVETGDGEISAQVTSKTFPSSLNEKFEIKALLGEGGMGTVYLVENRSDGQALCLKLLRNDAADDAVSRRRFLNEARITTGLDHENIVKVFDCGLSEEGTPFLLMEYIPGKTLAEILKEIGRLPQASIISIFGQVASALTHAHAKGIIHRDVKPGNVLVLSNENVTENQDSPTEYRIKLADFGIAKFNKSAGTTVTITRTGEVFGSPFYMSPEQCSGDKQDARSDIYSFGCMLYECLCGRPPFHSESAVQVIIDHLTAKPPLPRKLVPSVDRSLESLAMRCLEKERRDRYQSMQEIAADFTTISSGKPIKNTGRRLPVFVRAAIGAFIVLALGGAWLWDMLHPMPVPTKSGQSKKLDNTTTPINPREEFKGKTSQELVIMGYMYSYGEGTPHDYKKAADYYERASQLGNMEGNLGLGTLYESGLGVPKDAARAFELYKAGAHAGNMHCQHNLALMYDNGDGVPRDPVEAAFWYEKAADMGNLDSQINLANKYQVGDGVRKDVRKSVQLTRQAAEAQHPQAEFNLAQHYDTGDGVKRDHNQSFQWYSKAMQHGHAQALRRLGDFYLQGRGVKRDFKKAISYYKRGIEAGDPSAMEAMGHMYEDGHGVQRDYKRAFKEYADAARLEDYDAELKLAMMYRDGRGTQKNQKLADEWFSKLEKQLRAEADRGSSFAQHRLGEMYRDGNGVPKNRELALFWHNKAHEDGSPREEWKF